MSLGQPTPLSYYENLIRGNLVSTEITVDLSIDQAAAVLKASDYGILALDKSDLILLDQVMSVLKEELWP